MTTHTPRDDVYTALFEELAKNVDRSMPTGAVVPVLIDSVDADEETVHDVLQTLAEEGILVERIERGHLSDPEETCSVYYTAEDGPLAPVGPKAPAPDIHEEYEEETLDEIREQLGL
jgi:hypothetical protein